MQEALQAGDITSEQAHAARERYAAIHKHFVQAMAKEKDLLDEAKQLNEELLVSSHLYCIGSQWPTAFCLARHVMQCPKP